MKRLLCLLLVLCLLLSAASATTPVQPSALRTTEQGIQFIKNHEGFSARRYWDYSQYSIGYGTACGAGEYPGGISVQEADRLLRETLRKTEVKVSAFSEKNNLPLSEAQFDALVSFTYNVGTSWMSGSRLSRLLAGGNFTEVDFASALGIWCHARKEINRGLVLRRIRETQLFLYGDYTGKNSKQFYYLILDPDGGTVENELYFYPAGSAFGSLPVPVKAERKFLGWYSGTQLLTEDTCLSSNVVAKAHWQTPHPAFQAFSDLTADKWYYTCVDELYNRSIINGYSDGTFRPDGSVTVGEALKLILLAGGIGIQSPTEAHWAGGYALQASTRGYLSNAELADLDAPISRGVVAKLAAAVMEVAPARPSAFADTQAGYVAALHEAGIINGTAGGDGKQYFYPDKLITRAEFSAITYRILVH